MPTMDSVLTWMPFIAVAFSGLSVLISAVALNRTSKYQNFEYVPRLQMSRSSTVQFGSDTEPRFDFEGSLENKGPKPIRIRSVLMDMGHSKDRRKQRHYVIAEDFFIGAGDKWPIEFHKTDGEMQDTMKQLDSAECAFTLRVSHEDRSGKVIEGRYPLGGHAGPRSVIVVMGVGQALIYR